MLQQILQDLYVDPELLAELDEEQKQILFVKMREEQVRRWTEREADFEKEKRPPKTPKSGAKRVDFLLGKDGSEWVWVMGEHKNDLSIEEILEREAQEEARIQAEKEAQELREKEELELKRKIEAEKQRMQEENERLEREMKQKKQEAAKQPDENAKQEIVKIQEIKRRFEEQERKRLAELNEEQKVLRRRSLQVLDNMKQRRSSEIYVHWKETRQIIEKQAEEGSKEVEESWKVQEQKAKEADKEMREMAQRARLEYRESLRRTSNLIKAAGAFQPGKTPSENKPPVPPKKHLASNRASVAGTSKPRPLRPRSRNMVIDWFIREEKDKGVGLDPKTGKMAEWFHGIISRGESEKLLAGQENGAFLVRVSERVWGYTISYQENGRCKHFLIDTTDLGYQFFGASQVTHKSLADLVEFHKETPITISGKEVLIKPVGQVSDPPDYCELFQGRQTESTTL
ncbi:hypothetical protein BaRGS_00002014 [Batillaria attramentaria]|uniref:SH2 domain-containing protein n=1 Tax=Batillaria attramentaria TaxID=370345 RepID=A0ABD0M3Q6_9CAEN